MADIEQREDPQDDIIRARERTEETSGEEVRHPHFEDGFTLKTVIGALFIALIMLPGGLYLGLVAGQGIGDAAEWVTIVLFAEVARRSFQPLKRQEIYMLYYIAASLSGAVLIGRGIAGGPFGQLIWRAYFVGSPPATPFTGQIPQWAVPPAGSEAIAQRSFFNADWRLPILLLVIGEILGRVSWMSMGYALFRVTSDVEQLPFPMAPIAASGATALAEAGSKEESWRWQIFSTGAVIGMVFGFFYLAVPIFTGTVFGTPLTLLPIPFLDLTSSTESFAPTAIAGISLSLGTVLVGFVLPYEIVLGTVISSALAMLVLNPFLQNAGMFPNWIAGSTAIRTHLAVSMDFWMSVGIGLNLSIAVIGIAMVVKTLRENRQERIGRRTRRDFSILPKGRGDINIFWALGAWLASMISYIVMCHLLVPDFPLWILAFFGLVWSPMNSYVSARMIGLTGRGVGFPMLKEAVIVSTGYQRVNIWYAPVPLQDQGWAAQRFREIELTGTKFSSVLKAEAMMLPLILVASFVFWAFFWHTNPIPSAQFPFAQKLWPIFAQQDAIWQQINLPESEASNIIRSALKPPVIVGGAFAGFALYWIFSLARLSPLIYYGFVGGVGAMPPDTIPMFLGAWLGRRFFRRRFGEQTWSSYAPVLLAGFACGTGLIAMVSVALALIAKSVSYLPF